MSRGTPPIRIPTKVTGKLGQKELRRLAKARIKDAEILLRGRRYDGALYICGYAIEMALKARICRTLSWSEYRTTGLYERAFKSHHFEVLLGLTGREAKIYGSSVFTAAWDVVVQWQPDLRYRIIGTTSRVDVQEMIRAARLLLEAL